MKKLTGLIAIITLLISCEQHIPKEVKAVIDSAKENSTELEKVINHYNMGKMTCF